MAGSVCSWESFLQLVGIDEIASRTTSHTALTRFGEGGVMSEGILKRR